MATRKASYTFLLVLLVVILASGFLGSTAFAQGGYSCKLEDSRGRQVCVVRQTLYECDEGFGPGGACNVLADDCPSPFDAFECVKSDEEVPPDDDDDLVPPPGIDPTENSNGASGGGSNVAGGSSRPDPTIQNPLKFDTIEELLVGIGRFLFQIATPLLTIMILYGAFVLLTSAGSEERISRGKKVIQWAVIGFVVVFLAGGIATLVGNILGGGGGGGAAPSPVEEPGQIVAILNDVAGWMFTIFGALAVIFILLSAFYYLTSGGDTGRVDTARKTLTYAIVAIAVAVVAGGVALLIQNVIESGAS